MKETSSWQRTKPPRIVRGNFELKRPTAKGRIFKSDLDEYYYVRSAQDSAGVRSMISEWVGSALLARLGFPVATVEEVILQYGTKNVGSVGAELESTQTSLAIHFPCNPEVHCIFDFIPDHCAGKILNQSDFQKIRVADLWLCNSGFRQSLFVKPASINGKSVQNMDRLDNGLNTGSLVAVFLCQSECFGGVNWDFKRASNLVFECARPWCAINLNETFFNFVDSIASLADQAIDDAIESVPKSWLNNDDRYGIKLMEERLVDRASKIHLLVARMNRVPAFEQSREALPLKFRKAPFY